MVKDLYSENYDTLMKENEGDTNRWDYMLFSWTGRIYIIKNDYTSQGNVQFSVIPIKIPMAFFSELEQIILTLRMEVWKTASSQNNFEK